MADSVVYGANTLLPEDMATMPNSCNFIYVPTAGWGNAYVGSGGGSSSPLFLGANTGVTASSKSTMNCAVRGVNFSGTYNTIDWTKKLYLMVMINRLTSDTEAVARFQLKTVTTEGALAAKGIGIKVLNYAIWGESYGDSLGEVNLNTTMSDSTNYWVVMIFYPSSKIEWYVNKTLMGTQSTSAKLPTTTSASVLVHSIINGGTGGANAYLQTSKIIIWQEH